MSIKLCAIVPSHNHYLVIERLVRELRRKNLPVFIIDDGSSEPARSTIALLHDPENNIFVKKLEENTGKGGAVITGLKIAYKAGFTHAVQIDADGQHDITALPNLLGLAKQYPDALVSGKPVYDESIPKSRKIARWLTHVWVWVETLSFQIKDSMCGYRVYPLTQSLVVIEEETVGQRMDFDTEIMVRMFWRGTPTIMCPVKVTYPESNISNFDMVADNVRITKMHIRLVFSMLIRLPSILRNRPQKHKITPQWATMNERGMLFGLKFLATTYKLFGYHVCWFIIQPVLLYFFLTGKLQRDASKKYWKRIYLLEGKDEDPGLKQLWSHTRSFGHMCLDKFAAWMGDIGISNLVFSNETEFNRVISQDKGVLILASHLGNIEICRALSKKRSNIQTTIFVHTHNAVKFNKILESCNIDVSSTNVLQVTDIGPTTIIELQDRLDRGEWVVITGDRTPVEGQKRLSYVPFLGKEAPFPQGPIILASLLKCQVYAMLCMKEEDKYRIIFEKFSDQIKLPRNIRDKALLKEIAAYAAILERICKEYPLQWYNFFDFWPDEQ